MGGGSRRAVPGHGLGPRRARSKDPGGRRGRAGGGRWDAGAPRRREATASPARAAALRVITDRAVRRPGALIPRGRLVTFLAVLMVGFAAIVGRLAFVQGVSAGPYAAMGLSQRIHTVILPADRGSIFDRNGNELAMSVPRSTVWADPRLVTDPAREAKALASALHLDATAVLSRLSAPGAFSYVARTVDDASAAAVKALALPGVNLLAEPKRFDPDGSLAAPVIGRVGIDGEGLSGLEYQYDAELRGHPGRLVSEDDPSGRPIPGGFSQLTPATKGSDLVLTIDRSLQFEVEQDLANEMITARAKGGMAVVMDTRTGEVLAMANLVRSPGAGVVAAPANEALTSVYEPGSVQKLITISAALQQGAVRPTDVLTIPDRIWVAGSPFSDDTPHPVEHWTATDVVTASSNVGAITIARALGKAGLISYLNGFGLGHRTDLHFPGESAGLLLDPSKWSGTTIATVPIGQGIAVTAMQMVAAYNTIANGGVYIAPKLVRATVDPRGRTVPTPPSPTHRVVSPEVAREMTAMLTEVVRGGTGTAAAIDGYQVAGKTGTAREAVAGTPGYKPGAYVASFAGFVPATAPAFTAMVVLDEPNPIFGGLVSAPVFHDIATYALRELQVPPPPPDPGLFAGVPHAQAAAAAAADEPGLPPGSPERPLPSTTLINPPPPAVAQVSPPVTTASPATVPTTAAPSTTVPTTAAPGPATVPTTAAPRAGTAAALPPRRIGAGSVGETLPPGSASTAP